MDNYERVKQLCEGYRNKVSDVEEFRPRTVGTKRQRIISISDMHIPFLREDLIKEIVKAHSGSDYCVVNGDLFDSNIVSFFPKHKEIPFIVEYIAAQELVISLSQHFKKVILVDGNHDYGRFNTEIGKLNVSIQFLVKKSPMKHLADGVRFDSEGNEMTSLYLPNVEYAGDIGHNWWTKIGKVIFGHRLRGFRKAPMANVAWMADWFINRGTDFQCLVAGHSHKQGMIPYRGKILIDQGALCWPMDYELDGGCSFAPPDLGYAIVDIDNRGNVDTKSSRPVFLGTYQEA